MSSVAILQLHREHDVFCLLDPIDYAWAKQWLWNCGYFFDNKHRLYPKRNVGPDRASVYLHREIMQRAEPRPLQYVRSHLVDHVNCCTLDCRRVNPRWATQAENARNRRKVKGGNSIEHVHEIYAALLAAGQAIAGEALAA